MESSYLPILLLSILCIQMQICPLALSSRTDPFQHPLDPLSKSEISHVRRIILSSQLGSHQNLTFHYVTLEEPPKEAVQAWKSGSSSRPPRRAFVIARIPGETHEIGVFHDHFLTYYLDLDVDGTENSFVENTMKRIEVPSGESPRKSYWTVEKKVANTEDDAKIQWDARKPGDLVVVNPSKRTRVGQEVGYRLNTGPMTSTLLARDQGRFY